MVRDYYRKVLYRACIAAFFFFYGFLRLFRLTAFRRVCRPLLKLFIRITIPRKRIVRNLSAVFGKCYSDATKHGLARGVQDHFRENLSDCLFQLRDPAYARRSISITGLEHLRSSLALGRGAIALGAHLGNFVLVGARIGLEGYSVHTLFRIPADRTIQAIIKRYLPRYHQFVIPSLAKRVAVRRTLQALRRNEIAHILGDSLKKGKVDALLFGHRVFSSRGPVSLALRTEAPLLPVYLIRNYEGRMELIIEPAIELTRTGDLARDITENTQRVVSHLERLIRRYPDQWNWLTVRLSKNNLVYPQERNHYDLTYEKQCPQLMTDRNQLHGIDP